MNRVGTDPHPYLAFPLGYFLVLIAGVFWSFGGLVFRLIEAANEWQFLFYRSVILALTLLALLTILNHATIVVMFRTTGRTGIVAGLCLAGSFTSYVFALSHTTVANSLFLLSSSPFMAAILGRILLGEKVRRATWVAMSGAVVGVAVMVGEGVATNDLLGDIMALGSAFGFAGFTVSLRRRKRVEMWPAVCLSAGFTALAAGIMAIHSGYGLEISAHDLLFCAIYGGVVLGWGLAVYTIGSRHVPAAESTMLSLSEVVLGPIWVWLGIGEVPSGMTLVGGAIVLVSIVGLAVTGMRKRYPPIGVV